MSVDPSTNYSLTPLQHSIPDCEVQPIVSFTQAKTHCKLPILGDVLSVFELVCDLLLLVSIFDSNAIVRKDHGVTNYLIGLPALF